MLLAICITLLLASWVVLLFCVSNAKDNVDRARKAMLQAEQSELKIASQLGKARKERDEAKAQLSETEAVLAKTRELTEVVATERNKAVRERDEARVQRDTLQKLLDEAKSRLAQAIKERDEAKANFDQENRQKLDAIREKEEVEQLLRRTNENMASCIEENKTIANERNQVRANFLALLCDHGEAGRTIGELAHYVREMKKLACLAEERLPQQDHEKPATLPDDPITAEAPPSAADDFFEQYVAAANEVTECPWDHNPNITIVRRKEDGAIVGIRGIPTSVEYESLTKMIDDEEKARQRIEPGQESNPYPC